jgi:hypothetical protein
MTSCLTGLDRFRSDHISQVGGSTQVAGEPDSADQTGHIERIGEVVEYHHRLGGRSGVVMVSGPVLRGRTRTKPIESSRTSWPTKDRLTAGSNRVAANTWISSASDESGAR